jgi:peptide subunit release factor 1 (eRF1)
MLFFIYVILSTLCLNHVYLSSCVESFPLNNSASDVIEIFTDKDIARLNQTTHVILYYSPTCPISEKIYDSYKRFFVKWRQEHHNGSAVFGITDATRNTQLDALVRMRSFPLLVV